MDLSFSPSQIIMLLIALIVGIVLHEMMHAYAGYLLGDTTAKEQGRISLNPLNHIDPFMTIVLPAVTLLLFHAPFLAAKPVPFDPDRVKYDEFGAAMIAAAGPLTNFVLAVIAAVLLHVGGGGVIADFLNIFAITNIALFVFNLIPIPPLDGSRVVYAFAPEGIQDFMRQIEPYGFFVIMFLVLAVRGFVDIISNINYSIYQFLLR